VEKMTQEISSVWKKWFAIGFGFGVGAAVAATLILGGISWNASRPKPWKSKDLSATFSTPLYDLDDSFNIVGTELEYVVENKTMVNYTLSPSGAPTIDPTTGERVKSESTSNQTFFLQEGEALRRSLTGKYRIDNQCFIPAKTKVKCQITVPSDFDVSNGIDGFVVFDNSSRESIVFPKPTGPTPDDRQKTLVDMKNMAEKYHQNPGINHIAPSKHQP
jgi:hypothetical protein